MQVYPRASTYIKFLLASFATALAGAQTVHIIYKPLADFDELVAKRKKELLETEYSEETPAKL